MKQEKKYREALRLFYSSNKTNIKRYLIFAAILAFFDFFGLVLIIPITSWVLSPDIYSSYLAEGILSRDYSAFIIGNFIKIILFSSFVFYIFRATLQGYIVRAQSILSGSIHKEMLDKACGVYLKSDRQSEFASFVRIFTHDSLIVVYAFVIQASSLIIELFLFVGIIFVIVAYYPLFAYYIPLIAASIFIVYSILRKAAKRNASIVHKKEEEMISSLKDVYRIKDELHYYSEENSIGKAASLAFYEKTYFKSLNEALVLYPRILFEVVFILGVLIFLYEYSVGPDLALELQQGLVVFLIASGVRVMPMMNKISQSLTWFQSGIPALNSYTTFINEHHSMAFAPLKRKSMGKDVMLQINKLVVGYDRSKPLTSPISIDLKAGKTYAVIGRSGCGKSTFLKTVASLVEPISGIVYLRDESVINIRISYVPQSPSILSDTVLANILIDKPKTKYNIGLVWDALRIVGMYDKIKNLEKQLDTQLHEYNSILSGGQLYRIVIARALVHRADILLIDEPTAALDDAISKTMLSNIQDANKHMCILVSSHDDTVISASDLLINLDECRPE